MIGLLVPASPALRDKSCFYLGDLDIRPRRQRFAIQKVIADMINFPTVRIVESMSPSKAIWTNAFGQSPSHFRNGRDGVTKLGRCRCTRTI